MLALAAERGDVGAGFARAHRDRAAAAESPAGGGAFTGEGSSTSSASGPAVFRYSCISVFRFSLRVPKIACMPSPTTTTPAAPSALSLSGLALVTSASLTRSRVMQASRLTMFDAAAEGAHELQRELVAATRLRAAFAASSSTSRPGREQVEAADREGEDAVVDRRPDRPEHEQPQRAVRFRKEHDVVDEPVREGEAVLDARARCTGNTRRRRAARG